MFATEVDVDTIKRNPSNFKFKNLSSLDLKPVPFERALDIQHTERPTLLSTFETKEDQEFKGVISQIVRRTQLDTMQLENEILKKMRNASQSRGWKRVSGMKTAPMKVLIN